MSPIVILSIGFILGTLISAGALLALVGKYKLENLRARSWVDVLRMRIKQVDQQRSIVTKRMIDANAESEYLKVEIEKLRGEKLKAWDIPERF